MALFGWSKDKQGDGSHELVLAYLEDAQRNRSGIIVTDSRKLEVSGVISWVDEKAESFGINLQGSFSAEKGITLEFILYHENLRIWGEGRVVDFKGTSLSLSIPKSLQLKDRRKHPRVRLNPKEGVTLTALSGLFDGIGVHGLIESLSEGGCRVRVDKAMSIASDKRLNLGISLVPPGHSFPILKLNKVPKCPASMELSGFVVYADDSSGLCLGIRFTKSEVQGAIRNLVQSRVGNTHEELPPKVRRKPEENRNDSSFFNEEVSLVREDRSRREPPRAEAKPEAKAEAQAAAPAVPSGASDQAAPAPSKTEGATPSLDAAPVSEPSAPNAPSPDVPVRNLTLLRLKKRARSVLVLASESQGALLSKQLLWEGYQRVLVVQDWSEVVAHLNQDVTELFLVDIDLPSIECISMLQRLKDAGLTVPPVVLAASDFSRLYLMAAQQAGVTQLLVKPYVLDDAFSRQLEDAMGLN